MDNSLRKINILSFSLALAKSVQIRSTFSIGKLDKVVGQLSQAICVGFGAAPDFEFNDVLVPEVGVFF